MSLSTTNRRAGAASPNANAGIGSQHLIFSLGGELFGVGTMRVKEIIEYGNVTSVPMMPDYMRGVINLRGAVVPVIDLSARFGRQLTDISRRTCIVILEVITDQATHVLGIIVDAVSAVRQIDPSQVEPAPTFGTRIRADFIEGMAKTASGFVILMNLAKVLSVDELSTIQGPGNADEPEPSLALTEEA